MKYLILLLLPMFAQAATVTIDGRIIDSATVTITTGAAPPTQPPAPTPEPDPEPGPTPPGVIVKGLINWETPGARRVIDVPQGRVLAYPFKATGAPSHSGSVVISEVVGYEQATRKLWISLAPGGDPVSPAYRCSAEGVSAQNIKWAQSYNRFRCTLQPGQRYYLNITNTHGCSGSCRAYLSFLR